MQIGGITIRHGVSLGDQVTLDGLRKDFDAVFIGVGLPRTNALGLPLSETYENLVEAVDFIEGLGRRRRWSRSRSAGAWW